MVQPGDGILEKLAFWLAGIIGLLGGYLFKGVNSRVDEVKKTADEALPRAEFERARKESVDDRKTIRDDLKELFRRDDHLKDMLHEGFTAIREALSEQTTALRAEIQASNRRRGDHK